MEQDHNKGARGYRYPYAIIAAEIITVGIVREGHEMARLAEKLQNFTVAVHMIYPRRVGGVPKEYVYLRLNSGNRRRERASLYIWPAECPPGSVGWSIESV